jgi:hypothetical protein
MKLRMSHLQPKLRDAMPYNREVSESRLHEALDRLLKNQPKRVKIKGKLTLNIINREAGLSNSYVHKFPDFLAYAKPVIDDYNKNRLTITDEPILVQTTYSEVDKLRLSKNREERLKVKYRQERNDAVKAQVELEAINNTLMFRLFELQNELAILKGTVVNINDD